jgi:hypothetical protein
LLSCGSSGHILRFGRLAAEEQSQRKREEQHKARQEQIDAYHAVP